MRNKTKNAEKLAIRAQQEARKPQLDLALVGKAQEVATDAALQLFVSYGSPEGHSDKERLESIRAGLYEAVKGLGAFIDALA